MQFSVDRRVLDFLAKACVVVARLLAVIVGWLVPSDFAAPIARKRRLPSFHLVPPYFTTALAYAVLLGPEICLLAPVNCVGLERTA